MRVPDRACSEAVSSLVALTVFKTDGGRTPSLVSSILICLRQQIKTRGYGFFHGPFVLCGLAEKQIWDIVGTLVIFLPKAEGTPFVESNNFLLSSPITP